MRTFKEWRDNNGSAQFPTAGAYVSNRSLNEDDEYEDDEYDDEPGTTTSEVKK